MRANSADSTGSDASGLVQGTLEMLILKTLALEPMHGYGHVRSGWRASENNRRAKYYQLTAKGQRALESETEQWQKQISAIARILEA